MIISRGDGEKRSLLLKRELTTVQTKPLLKVTVFNLEQVYFIIQAPGRKVGR